MPLATGSRFGDYEVIGTLGSGGMGQVFKARDSRLGRTVALKVVSTELTADARAAARLEREARTLASVSHPHVCALFQLAEHEERCVLFMEFLILNDAITPALGEITHLTGHVLTKSGQPVRNAFVEIWQVDHNGSYVHTGGRQPTGYDGNFQGYGRFLTDAKGQYYFRTIKPIDYTLQGIFRTAHIHVAVSQNGRRTFTTQLLVNGHPANARDGLSRRLDPAALKTLLVDFTPLPGSKLGELTANFEIVLGATVNELELRGARFRLGQAGLDCGSGLGHGAESADHYESRRADDGRRDARHRGLHGSGAGQGQTRRQARGHLGLRLRALRDGAAGGGCSGCQFSHRRIAGRPLTHSGIPVGTASAAAAVAPRNAPVCVGRRWEANACGHSGVDEHSAAPADGRAPLAGRSRAAVAGRMAAAPRQQSLTPSTMLAPKSS
jgi:protocatechuate 3,4-dioxygenase beta subunit